LIIKKYTERLKSKDPTTAPITMAAACPGVKDINGDDWIGGKPFSPVSIVDMAFENSQLTLFGRIVCSPGAF
jgi:hypothetical protein